VRLKPAKCRSFSTRSGLPSRINFNIGKFEYKYISRRAEISWQTFFSTGKLSDAFDYMKSEFERKLININSLLTRDEYRV